MKGNNLLYTHATTDGKYKYYIANSNDTLNAIDGSGSKINARDPDEWMLTEMREAISRVDNELGLSFKEVNVRSEANLIINVRTELNSDYATTVNPGSVADFLLKTADEIIFELNITIPYDYSGNEPTIISSPNDNDKQGFTNRFLHELGHVMGLEHPWDKDDNDWATQTFQDSHTSSRMGYNEQLDSKYTWYSDTDIAALESLWGKDDEDSPIFLGVRVNYSTGILILECQETLSFSTPSRHIVGGFVIANTTSTYNTSLAFDVPLIGASFILPSPPEDTLSVTIQLTELQRVKAISSSGTPGGDGIANTIIVEPGSTEDLIGNKNTQQIFDPITEAADVIIPIVENATIDLNNENLNINLYGKRIKVELLEFLRSETKFNSLSELKKQIELDTKMAYDFHKLKSL